MNVAYLSARKRETEVIAGMSELPCGMRVARNKGTEGKRETVRPILIAAVGCCVAEGISALFGVRKPRKLVFNVTSSWFISHSVANKSTWRDGKFMHERRSKWHDACCK